MDYLSVYALLYRRARGYKDSTDRIFFELTTGAGRFGGRIGGACFRTHGPKRPRGIPDEGPDSDHYNQEQNQAKQIEND